MAKISTEEKAPHQFPAGLRVLAIHNDSTVRENIKQMCIRYNYQVVTYPHALNALNHVRERKNSIDVILIDVDVPSTSDSYEILRHIMKEIDVPVIVMSDDDAKSSVMKSIKEGACDYWIKPLHEDQFRIMWMHVARKAWKQNQLDTRLVTLEDNDRKTRGHDDSGFASSSVIEGVRNCKRSSSRETGIDESEDYEPPAKKSRVVWAAYLRNKFDDAVMQLGGLDKAVPKRILELMKEPTLTRDNVASHLQKCREHAKNRSKRENAKNRSKQNGMSLPNTVPETIQYRVGESTSLESQALAPTNYVCFETQATLHPGQWPNQFHAEQDVTYGHSSMQESLMFQQMHSVDSQVTEYGFIEASSVQVPAAENNQVEDIMHGYTDLIFIPLQGSTTDAALGSSLATVSDTQLFNDSTFIDSLTPP
ncbi:Two-component response regulator ORR21, partial [Mucuna pruriens]